MLFETLAGVATVGLVMLGVVVSMNRKCNVNKLKSYEEEILLFGNGVCFLLLAGVASSESELELLDDGALPLFDWAGVATFGLAGCFFTSSSDESEDDDSCFFLMLLFAITEGFVIDETAGVVGAKIFKFKYNDHKVVGYLPFTDETGCVGFLFVGASSSESLLLLLELAAFFVIGVETGLAAGVVGFCLIFSSSDESESDDESFFFEAGTAACVDTTGFLITGVTATKT